MGCGCSKRAAPSPPIAVGDIEMEVVGTRGFDAFDAFREVSPIHGEDGGRDFYAVASHELVDRKEFALRGGKQWRESEGCSLIFRLLEGNRSGWMSLRCS